MEIVTLAFNRPDFIELQFNSFKKWIKEDFTFTVYDNCPDDSVLDECKRLGIKCIPIKQFSSDPSWVVGLSLNKMWETLQLKTGELWYIDSDMFLVNELPKLDCDMAFVPQIRGEIRYPWTGLMYFNMDTLPYPEELQWNVDYEVKDTDVGGKNYKYLQENTIREQEFEMWTLVDRYRYSKNGTDILMGSEEHKQIYELVKDFPRPYSVDMIKMKDYPFFVFHYKSASNYSPFHTPEYNELKTKELKKIL